MKLTRSDTDIIMHTKLFRGTAESVLAKMVSGTECEIRSYGKDEVIYSKNYFSHSLGIILSGSVRVLKENTEGSYILLNTLGGGSIFGAAALFNDEVEYISELRTVEPCRVVFFSQRLIRRGIERDHRLAENYIRFLSDRILFLNRKINLLTSGNAQQRFASFLLDNLSSQDFAKLPITMTQLSSELNISRASLYRVLDELVVCGAVEKSGKKIRIADADKLAAAAKK